MLHPLWGGLAAPASPRECATGARNIALGLLLALPALSSCAPAAPAPLAATVKTAPAVAVAAASFESPPPAHSISEIAPVEMEAQWQGFGAPKCAYLAPKGDFIGDDGGIDVVFHFHAGQMSDRDMRASGVRGVFVSCGYGEGTSGYSRAFEDPGRFGWMMRRLTSTIGTAAKRSDVHLRRLALASWSAGFAAVSRILSVPEWYAATDTVVLLDSLHAQYTVDPPKLGIVAAAPSSTSARGADHVDVRMLKQFVRFATDATLGKKTMVITHSSIIPPDYASTSESTAALLTEVGVVPVASNETAARGASTSPTGGNMAMSVKADEGGLHVRGFRGMGPHDHFDHLHLIGDTLRSWVVPRWYTPPGERP